MAFLPTRLPYRRGRCLKALDSTQLQAKSLALSIGQGKGFEVELADGFLTTADHTDEPFAAAFDDLEVPTLPLCCVSCTAFLASISQRGILAPE
ncbi:MULTISPECIES: hypothetical protein [unclassified Mesorhizobium]|uniref:hypothetical protein n=1 Tax=unclassified Mesorhizobium TaxID=325217 RepID=UPI001ABEFDA7|nr:MULTISPECIES: hypothetical protein [unclassified Mesorhizobium]